MAFLGPGFFVIRFEKSFCRSSLQAWITILGPIFLFLGVCSRFALPAFQHLATPLSISFEWVGGFCFGDFPGRFWCCNRLWSGLGIESLGCGLFDRGDSRLGW